MGRDLEKAKGVGKAKRRPVNKADDAREPQDKCGDSRRGWRDVFDDIEYTDGPGDNIYVFG